MSIPLLSTNKSGPIDVHTVALPKSGWEYYNETATFVDNEREVEWEKSMDVILVFVCLVCASLLQNFTHVPYRPVSSPHFFQLFSSKQGKCSTKTRPRLP
jgi:hypothetical protein